MLISLPLHAGGPIHSKANAVIVSYKKAARKGNKNAERSKLHLLNMLFGCYSHKILTATIQQFSLQYARQKMLGLLHAVGHCGDITDFGCV